MLADALENWVRSNIAQSDAPPILMISGAQGIGKTTALHHLDRVFGGRLAMLGLDDFYLPHADRMALAEKVSDLFQVRGPPGTHDLPLLNTVIDQLLSADTDTLTPLPVFDKKIDDRLPASQWTAFAGRPDAIILEGWLIGALPDPQAATSAPLNRIEMRDHDGAWRRWQEDALAGAYAELWDRGDAFFHIDAPAFEVVLGWRIQQEETTLGLTAGSLPEERRKWVEDFILYYERLTRRMIEGDKRPGERLRVDRNRRPLAPDD